MSAIVVVMEFDRETKRTRRYIETADEPLIGTLYVPKSLRRNEMAREAEPGESPAFRQEGGRS